MRARSGKQSTKILSVKKEHNVPCYFSYQVRNQTIVSHLLNCMLGRLRLLLSVNAVEVVSFRTYEYLSSLERIVQGDIGDMDIQKIPSANLVPELTQSLDKRLTFDIAYCTTLQTK